MIDSGIFTRSSIFQLKDLETEEINLSQSISVNKSTMYHLVSSHLYNIFIDSNLNALQKQKIVFQYGFKLGSNLAEQECMGFVKHSVSKGDPKNPKEKSQQRQYVSEMKILNGKIWITLVGSKAKLYAVSDKDKGICFKIQDQQFTLGKSIKKQQTPEEIAYYKLLIQYCHGIVKGTLQRFDLTAQVVITDGAQRSIHVQIQKLMRKSNLNNYQEYYQKINETNNFI